MPGAVQIIERGVRWNGKILQDTRAFLREIISASWTAWQIGSLHSALWTFQSVASQHPGADGNFHRAVETVGFEKVAVNSDHFTWLGRTACVHHGVSTTLCLLALCPCQVTPIHGMHIVMTSGIWPEGNKTTLRPRTCSRSAGIKCCSGFQGGDPDIVMVNRHPKVS